MPIRTLIVDDHRSYAEALALALSTTAEVIPVGSASSVADALPLLLSLKPDVVVLDWQLPDTDGIEGMARMRAMHPDAVFVIVSGHAAYIEQLARSAGAAAVLPKESSIAAIADAIVRCANGEHAWPVYIPDDDTVTLTPREAEVLWLLAKGRDAQRIADDLFLSVHTVRGYIKDLRQKFRARSQLEVVAAARAQRLLP